MSNESQYTVDSARIAFSVPTIVEVRINIASSPRSSSPISSDLVSRAAFSRYAKRDVIFILHWKFHGNKIIRIWLALERDVIDTRGKLHEEISLSFHDKCWSRFRRKGKAWFDQPVTYYTCNVYWALQNLKMERALPYDR